MFQKSYAVLWREGSGPVKAGKLVLGPTSLCLESGSGRGRVSSRVLRYAELTDVGSATLRERISSRPTAFIDRSGGERLAIAVMDGLGSVREIVERLSTRLTPRTQA